MGILGNLFHHDSNPDADTGILDLNKGDILDLNKYSETLTKVRASAGWRVNAGLGQDYDLDLCAYLVNKSGKLKDTVYYNNKKSKGISLDKDDRVGSKKQQDNENIFVNLDKIPEDIETIYFAVVIYDADLYRQVFSHVKDAYVRLVDESDNNKEICRFRMTEDGGSNTAVLAAKLARGTNGWEFSGIGKYSKDTIQSLGNSINI